MAANNPPRGGPDASEIDGAGSTLGRYRLLKKIARGGMAEVFAARSFGAHGFEKTLAIKRILRKFGDDPQFVRMMVDEAKITVQLNHPNVAQIMELCEQDGEYFIVMEFVPGTSLSALRKKLVELGDRMPELEACFITIELLQGLHAAHTQRDAAGNPAHIIHRDVSPQNVLVSYDGHVKVIDFGIARARHRLELTEVGTIKGKLRYLAPEMIDPARFMASGDFDHRVDVFAAGIVLWELLASRTLYQGEDEMVVYDSITDHDAPDLHGMKVCDRDLARIAQKALARSPDERFESAEAFADALRAYLYRRDPTFTHKRVAALFQRCFPEEKQEMMNLERGAVAGQSGGSAPAPEAPRQPPVAPTVAVPARRASRPELPRVPAPSDPRPVPQDAPTRTHLGSASGNSGPAPSAPRHDPIADAAPGEVLTVMTLVSRKSIPRGAAAAGPASAGHSKEAPTLTANARAPAPDETPHTHGEMRTGSRARTRRTMRGRLMLVSAGAGIGVAVVMVALFQLSSGATSVAPKPPEPQRVTVTVLSSTPGASVSVAGRVSDVPTSLEALPGDVLDVVVSAAGYVERTERVRVPRVGAQDVTLDISLVPAPQPAPPPIPAVEVDAGPTAVADAGTASAPPRRPVERRPVADKRPGELKVTLKAAKGYGDVLLDGKFIDTTPAVVKNLAPGRYRVTVVGKSGKRVERNVTVRPGETTTEEVDVE